MNFRSKVCVITGASGGIGRRTAIDLSAAGATVCAAARREERLRSLLDEIGGPDSAHSYFVTDVSKRDDAYALAAYVERTYGRCDVLINNAGFSRRRSFEEPDALDALEAVMATNFYGAVYCTKAFLPLLTASAPAHVVNVASIAGRLAFRAASSYCASKFALVGWSEALHFELSARRVFVSLVEPGPLPTEGFPQSELQDDAILSRALTTTEAVSAAIRDAVAKKKVQRVVPRWYYLFQLPRLLTPPLYRFAQEKALKGRDPARH